MALTSNVESFVSRSALMSAKGFGDTVPFFKIMMRPPRSVMKRRWEVSGAASICTGKGTSPVTSCKRTAVVSAAPSALLPAVPFE